MPVLSSAFCRGRLAVSRMCAGSASRRQSSSCLRRIDIASLTGVGMVPAESMPAVTKPMQRNEPDNKDDPNPVTCKPFHLFSPNNKRSFGSDAEVLQAELFCPEGRFAFADIVAR